MKPVTIEWLEKIKACPEGIKYFVELDQEYNNPIKLCKKLKDDGKIEWLSWLAYRYCLDIEDNPEVRKYITDSYLAYSYCKDIKDRPYKYCKNIEDRPEIRKYITSSDDAYMYCRYIKDRQDISKYITEPLYAYCYCNWVKDRPEIRKYITAFKGMSKTVQK